MLRIQSPNDEYMQQSFQQNASDSPESLTENSYFVITPSKTSKKPNKQVSKSTLNQSTGQVSNTSMLKQVMRKDQELEELRAVNQKLQEKCKDLEYLLNKAAEEVRRKNEEYLQLEMHLSQVNKELHNCLNSQQSLPTLNDPNLQQMWERGAFLEQENESLRQQVEMLNLDLQQKVEMTVSTEFVKLQEELKAKIKQIKKLKGKNRILKEQSKTQEQYEKTIEALKMEIENQREDIKDLIKQKIENERMLKRFQPSIDTTIRQDHQEVQLLKLQSLTFQQQIQADADTIKQLHEKLQRMLHDFETKEHQIVVLESELEKHQQLLNDAEIHYQEKIRELECRFDNQSLNNSSRFNRPYGVPSLNIHGSIEEAEQFLNGERGKIYSSRINTQRKRIFTQKSDMSFTEPTGVSSSLSVNQLNEELYRMLEKENQIEQSIDKLCLSHLQKTNEKLQLSKTQIIQILADFEDLNEHSKSLQEQVWVEQNKNLVYRDMMQESHNQFLALKKYNHELKEQINKLISCETVDIGLDFKVQGATVEIQEIWTNREKQFKQTLQNEVNKISQLRTQQKEQEEKYKQQITDLQNSNQTLLNQIKQLKEQQINQTKSDQEQLITQASQYRQLIDQLNSQHKIQLDQIRIELSGQCETLKQELKTAQDQSKQELIILTREHESQILTIRQQSQQQTLSHQQQLIEEQQIRLRLQDEKNRIIEEYQREKHELTQKYEAIQNQMKDKIYHLESSRSQNFERIPTQNFDTENSMISIQKTPLSIKNQNKMQQSEVEQTIKHYKAKAKEQLQKRVSELESVLCYLNDMLMGWNFETASMRVNSTHSLDIGNQNSIISNLRKLEHRNPTLIQYVNKMRDQIQLLYDQNLSFKMRFLEFLNHSFLEIIGTEQQWEQFIQDHPQIQDSLKFIFEAGKGEGEGLRNDQQLFEHAEYLWATLVSRSPREHYESVTSCAQNESKITISNENLGIGENCSVPELSEIMNLQMKVVCNLLNALQTICVSPTPKSLNNSNQHCQFDMLTSIRPSLDQTAQLVKVLAPSYLLDNSQSQLDSYVQTALSSLTTLNKKINELPQNFFTSLTLQHSSITHCVLKFANSIGCIREVYDQKTILADFNEQLKSQCNDVISMFTAYLIQVCNFFTTPNFVKDLTATFIVQLHRKEYKSTETIRKRNSSESKQSRAPTFRQQAIDTYFVLEELAAFMTQLSQHLA